MNSDGPPVQGSLATPATDTTRDLERSKVADYLSTALELPKKIDSES